MDCDFADPEPQYGELDLKVATELALSLGHEKSTRMPIRLPQVKKLVYFNQLMQDDEFQIQIKVNTEEALIRKQSSICSVDSPLPRGTRF